MFSAPHLGGRTSPSPVLRQILWIPSSSGNGALAEPRCFSWSGSTNLPDGRTQSGFLSLFDGSNASSSASVSSSLIPEAGSSSSSPWLMGECNLIFWCHPFRISLDPRGSVRIFLLHSQRSNRLAITRQWNELPSAAIRCTSSISFSSGVPPFFLNKALVCPLWKPINLSLSSADATLISSPPLRLIKNCAWYVYGGNFILSLRHLCSVPSSHCFIPAGLGGGRRRGIALVKVGSFAWSSISAAGHPHPSSHTPGQEVQGDLPTPHDHKPTLLPAGANGNPPPANGNPPPANGHGGWWDPAAAAHGHGGWWDPAAAAHGHGGWWDPAAAAPASRSKCNGGCTGSSASGSSGTSGSSGSIATSGSKWSSRTSSKGSVAKACCSTSSRCCKGQGQSQDVAEAEGKSEAQGESKGQCQGDGTSSSWSWSCRWWRCSCRSLGGHPGHTSSNTT